MRITRKALKRIILESVVPLFQNKFGKIEIYYSSPRPGNDDDPLGGSNLKIRIFCEGEDLPVPSAKLAYQNPHTGYINIDPSLGIEDRSNKKSSRTIFNSNDEPGLMWEAMWDLIPKTLKDKTGITIPEDWFRQAEEKVVDEYDERNTEAKELEDKIHDGEDDEDYEDYVSRYENLEPIDFVLIRMIDGSWHLTTIN